MTEQEWLASGDPKQMLALFKGIASARKFRLFRAACCRRVLPLLKDPHSRAVMEREERFADLPEKAVRIPFKAAGDDGSSLLQFNIGPYFEGSDEFGAALRTAELAISTRTNSISQSYHSFPYGAASEGSEAGSEHLVRAEGGCLELTIIERRGQADLVRDLFGNPFQSVPFDLCFATATVTALAQAIYDEQRFGDLPVLADALEETGCSNADILNHCRGPGPHVRGCWVIDLILQKT